MSVVDMMTSVGGVARMALPLDGRMGDPEAVGQHAADRVTSALGFMERGFGVDHHVHRQRRHV